MLFNSIEFLLFLPLVLLGYALLKKQRILFLLASSYFFYGWWNWHYLGLIVFSTTVDFYCGQQLGDLSLNDRRRKYYLALSLFANLGLLFFFKYFNFFNAELASFFDVLGMNYLIPYSSFLLPMGISFYTFQTLSYTIDVYHGRIKPENDFKVFALFVSYFPQLVAGPIERAGHLITQLKSSPDIKPKFLTRGMDKILIGLFKKVVIADRLAMFVDQVYNDPQAYDGAVLILATFMFAFQIYCDFSGYSDIAIGVARLFGIELMENFKSPYFSHDVREFWSRWHISLSTWFRDYVYIPLGGNRNSSFIRYRNLMLVFIVSGLWHGANWTFLIWGGLHGSYLLLGRAYSKFKSKKDMAVFQLKSYNRLEVGVTFFLVCFAWIFFRANSISDAYYIITNLADGEFTQFWDILYQLKIALFNPSNLVLPLNLEFGKIYFQSTIGDFILSFFFIITLLLYEFFSLKGIYVLKENTKFIVYLGLIITIILFGVFTKNQFIYFQF